MKNQHFEPWVFMWMLLVVAFIPAVLASQWFDHSMIVFGLVYLLVVALGFYVIFRCHCMNTNQSETAKKYREDIADRLNALKKIMLADWTPDEGVDGSHLGHRWVMKFVLNRNTSLLNKMINKQARSYAALDKMKRLKKEHPKDVDGLNKMVDILKKEVADREAFIEELQKDVVTLRIDLMKYDAAKGKR